MLSIEDVPLNIAIVEDDPAVRQSMAGILKRASGVKCTGIYGSGEEALREIPQQPPQVVLMDINLPGMSGVDCVRKLSSAAPGLQILMLTMYEDTDSIFDSLAAGACGYLLKPVRTAELLAALRDVAAGGAPMSSNIARKVVQSFTRVSPALAPDANLTQREREILDHLAKGLLYKEISDLLGIGYSTVHTHIERIYKKLHVRSRAQAVAKYLGA